MDNGTPEYPGSPLQRIQLVKGWHEDGELHEKVLGVAGGDNDASVDINTCEPAGSGHSQLCKVWQDNDFNPSAQAFYYTRVLENPSCRWSTLHCQAAGVNPFAPNCAEQAATKTERMKDNGAIGDVYGKCCLDSSQQPFYSPTLQERAWTSPIWMNPRKT